MLALSLAIVGLFGWLTWHSGRAAATANFDALAWGTADAIEDRLDAYVDVLVGGAALFTASEHVSAVEFRRYVRSLRVQERYPGIQGVGYTVRVSAANRDSLVAAQRAAGFPDFTIHPDGRAGNAADGRQADAAPGSLEQHTIVYLEPLDERNRAAIGFDMYSQPVRRAAMARARDSGRPSASGTVTLVQEIDEDVQPGFLIYVPVYRGGGRPATVAERRRDLVGFVYAPFRIHDLISAALDSASLVGVRLYDDVSADSATLLFVSDVRGEPAPEADADAPFRRSIELDVQGQTWLAVVSGGDTLYDPFSAWLTRAAFGMGLLAAVVLFLLMRSQERSRGQAQRAAEALRESEEQYRVLFEGNPHPMWVYDLETTGFLAVNDAARARYGYTRDEFLSMTLADIRPADDRELLERNLAGESAPSVWRHLRKDGSIRLVEVTAGSAAEFAGRPARLVLAHDVTERIEAEHDLQQAQLRLRQILNLSNAVIYTMDVADGGVATTWVTDNLQRVTGYTAEEGLAPGWWYEGLHPDDRDFVAGTLSELFTEGRRSMEYRFRRKDGSYIWIRDDAVVRRNPGGEAEEVIGAWLDVSDRRRLEEQFQQAQKMEAVGRLAGGIAHDFNNTLTVIRSQTDLLLMEMARDPRAEDLVVIQTAADRAARLTSQLLAFSREQLLRPSVVDAADVVRGMGAMLSRIVGERMRIRHELAPDLPRIEVDAGQLEQAILNLAVNARDAMPEGGVLTFSTRAEDVDAMSSTRLGDDVQPGRYVVLSVADTGTGMSDTVRARIFDPFFTTKPKGEGTGLGLPMVYGFVTQSGGTVRVTSEPGQGTTFHLYFPATEKTPEAPAPAPGAPPVETALAGTVLLVEDEPSVARVSRRILERAGLRVREAMDAETALGMLDEPEPVDLLVTDVGLPGMSGRQLIEELRIRGRQVPAVLMSGYAEGVKDAPDELPRDVEFVQKPFAPEVLIAAVRRALGYG